MNKKFLIGFVFALVNNFAGLILVTEIGYKIDIFYLTDFDRKLLIALLPKILTFSALINMPFFFWFIRKNKINHARGVVFYSGIIVLVILVLSLL